MKKTRGINWSSVARKAFSLGHTLETIAVTRRCVVRMNRTGHVKGRKDIPDWLWKRILASMPIPCVDIIVQSTFNRPNRVLLGYRKIYPYNDCWALPGGRIVKDESLRDTANRQMREIGLTPHRRLQARWSLPNQLQAQVRHERLSLYAPSFTTGTATDQRTSEIHMATAQRLARASWLQLQKNAERLQRHALSG